MRTETITLTGHVPSKKNNYRRTVNGGLMVDREIAAYIDGLVDEAKIRWGKRKPFDSASVDACFYVRDGRADLDNKYVTLSDVLVKAGVLANDSIARVKRLLVMAVIDPKERVVVTLTEAA